MNIFQKIAVFIIRVIAVVFVLFGINGFAYTILLAISPAFKLDGFDATQGVISGAFYFIMGVAFLLFAVPIGKLIGRGLDD